MPVEPRSYVRTVRTRRALALAVVVGTMAAAFPAASCGAFTLHDVIPEAPPDVAAEATPDAVATDAPRQADGALCDGGTDPCACLETPTMVSTGGGGVQAFVIDAVNAYWLGGLGNPSVYTTPLDGDGGAPVTLVPSISWGGFGALAIDSQYLYVDIGSTAPFLERMPLDGDGGFSRITALPMQARDLRVNTNGLYWTNLDSEACVASLDGGLPLPLSDAGCGGRALGSPTPSDAAVGTGHLAIGDASVYWSDDETGDIWRVPMVGGSSFTVFKGGGYQPKPLVASDTDVFWSVTNADSGTIFHALSTGGAPSSVVANVPIAGFTVDATDVYFIAGANTSIARQIFKVPRGGGSPTLLACDSGKPQFVAVDGQNVYWANAGDGHVRRVSK